jgi:glucose/arabinose dehydrogenase
VRGKLLSIALTASLAMLMAMPAGCGGEDASPEQTGASTPSAPAPGEGSAPSSSGRAAGQGVRLERVGTFDEPLYVTAPPGDRNRVFVVEKGGKVQLVVKGRRASRPFLDLSGDVSTGGEQGLLSMAFAPDYRRTGRFYVDFTDRGGNTRVQEFKRSRSSPNRADRGSRRQILFVRQPFENHNGGLVLFGPDRLLYVGLGDGGAGGDPGNRAQRLDTLLGKILRIDPRRSGAKRYRSPRGNPFVGRPGRDEIYTYGMRNPWRFSFDARTRDLYIGDVGQNRYEEIDYARAGSARGKNYGWSCFEGRHVNNSSRRCPGSVGPVLEYGRGSGACSVTGGVVVRDAALSGLYGRYVYGDLCRGQLRSFRIAGGRATDDRTVGLRVSTLSSFGVDGRGRVYATSLEGAVYRLVGS